MTTLISLVNSVVNVVKSKSFLFLIIYSPGRLPDLNATRTVGEGMRKKEVKREGKSTHTLYTGNI